MGELERAVGLLPKDGDGAVRYEVLELWFGLQEEAKEGMQWTDKET